MHILLVYSHPCEESYGAALRDRAVESLKQAGHSVDLLDLYAEGFNPVLDADERRGYHTPGENEKPIADHLARLRKAEGLIFVYPTWWYGLPAMLKGWLDRVLVPGVAFLMPDRANATIRPGLRNIERLGVFTTCGASFWLTRFVGAPGRRTLLRGVGLLCAPRCRKTFAAHYLMDSSTDASRARHLARVGRKIDRFLGRPAMRPAVRAEA